MKIPTILPLLPLLTLTTAHPIETRSIPMILKDFAMIGERLIALDKAVKTHAPTNDMKMALERLHTNVEMGIVKATNDVHSTPFLKSKMKESSFLANTAVKMQPFWISYLHDIVDKKAVLDEEMRTGRIREFVIDFQQRCHVLAVSLEAILAPEDARTIRERNSELDVDFFRTIDLLE
ncbi:hypothetical protein BDV25DRAFT_136980 [Aspergillus avenaceus]|uniref:Hydrophobic surface binding protein A-domain-containing protein n=1 Tax=Aspergillus avenaceus TaxID=36643 RepID=A0A5N6U415_ASPAV|nr:hypothetical protein BDV25DRAFT_136980 [Aspergillus avenaceus]